MTEPLLEKFYDYGYEDIHPMWLGAYFQSHPEFPVHIYIGDAAHEFHVTPSGDPEQMVEVGVNDDWGSFQLTEEPVSLQEAWGFHQEGVPALKYLIEANNQEVYELLDGRIILVKKAGAPSLLKGMSALAPSGTAEEVRRFYTDVLSDPEPLFLSHKDIKRYFNKATLPSVWGQLKIDPESWSGEGLSSDDLDVALDMALEQTEYEDPEGGWGLEYDPEKGIVYLQGYTPFRLWKDIEDRGLRPVRRFRRLDTGDWVSAHPHLNPSLKAKLMR